ncbi:MAG: DMT family transporter [Myxococcales bacterium]|nr:DMT family transporter [Myxococcales bacterium]MCB9644328.1 DMT family transporter [Myxococcales bacterium]
MQAWFRFVGLALIWGSSYLLIKLVIRQIDPLTLVWIRLTIAASLFIVYLRMTGRVIWPEKGRGALIYVGIMNTALPFFLVSWGQAHIDSSLGTILTSTTPFFSLLLAHFLVEDERLTAQKIFGLLLGFGGVVLLSFRALGQVKTGGQALLGQFSILAASACYASCLIVIRRSLKHIEPIVIAGATLLIGAIAITPVMLLAASPWKVLTHADSFAWGMTLTLSVIHTVIAYFLFYSLVASWGPRASLVTYAMPPVGITLGAIFLKELIDTRLLLGGALILLGIVLVQARLKRPSFQPNTR